MQKFNYHTHTYRCGHADEISDEEYIKEYIKMGFEKIAFTDHCPEKNENDKRPNIRMEYKQRKEYLNSINMLKEKYSGLIEIETGYEIEYLPGEEENLKELKNESDKIILGQHFVYDNNKEIRTVGNRNYSLTDEELIKYAEYIEKAMELNLPDIIAHPDMYMLRRNGGFLALEAEVANRICRAAEKYNIPLEINLNNIFAHTYYEDKKLNNIDIEKQKEKLSKVYYPCKEFWRIASQYNVKVLYGLDVHHKGQILLWNELRELANEIIGKDILEKLNFIDNL